MSKPMPGAFRWILCAVLIITAGWTPPGEAATKAKESPPAADDDGGSPGCSLYAAGVVDAMSQSAAYMFIGNRPMCADAARKRQFCEAINTREGYETVRDGSAAADDAAEIAKSLPEESREFFLQQHPKHSLESAMATCGLKLDQLRARLASDAEAGLRTSDPRRLDADLAFLKRDSPANVQAIWTRECAGHVAARSEGEMGFAIDYKGSNPAYAKFCQRTSKVDNPKAPPAFSK